MHDPKKQARRDSILQECKARGIQVTKRGLAYWLLAPGVDIKVADLADVEISALHVYQPLQRD